MVKISINGKTLPAGKKILCASSKIKNPLCALKTDQF